MRRFPFSAVVGHHDEKLALLLCALDPHIGGVLLRGQKGSAKTTLARGLARLLGQRAPFAELPLGATEDRLVGTLDLGAALTGGERRFEPGLLSRAHGGVLYVDEVNLLADHLVDVLLDVAVSGVNQVEREGISHEHPARFVLIGSMNPEEGELRPQLLDRFGLSADVAATTNPAERAEAVRRRLAFDADPEAFHTRWASAEAELHDRLESWVPGLVDDDLLVRISTLCASLEAEGLRADLVIARAAAAHAGWHGRSQATDVDVRAVAHLALAHRRRRNPFEDPGLHRDELDNALDDAFDAELDAELDDVQDSRWDNEPGQGPVERPNGRDDAGSGPDRQGDHPSLTTTSDRVAAPDAPNRVVPIRGGHGSGGGIAGRRSLGQTGRGRLVGDREPQGSVSSVALGATARAVAARRALDPDGALLEAADVREAVRQERTANLVVLCVDASGSMNSPARMEATKGAVLSLLLDAYQRRDRVALVTFRDDAAQVVLRPTGSIEVARARLDELPTGGRTPLAAGIQAALDLANAGVRSGFAPLIVLLSDGRATSGPQGTDAMVAARAAAAAVRQRNIDAVVVDVEDGPVRLNLAGELAAYMGARLYTLPELSAGALTDTLRDVLGRT